MARNQIPLRYVALVCLLAILCTTAAVRQVGPIVSINIDQTSTYTRDVDALVTSLIYKASRAYFGTASIGGAYGLFLCSDDASQQVCLSCVQQAAELIVYKQPNGHYSEESYVWYDVCFFRYSNINFFGSLESRSYDEGTKCTSRNTSITEDSKIMSFLSELADQASARETRFASGVNASMYGSAQCTKDISNDSCTTCLRDSVRAIGSICQERGGGSHLAVGCGIRYLNSSLVELSKPPPGYPRPVRQPQPDAGCGFLRVPAVWLWLSAVLSVIVCIA